jgi:hypothetical protein
VTSQWSSGSRSWILAVLVVICLGAVWLIMAGIVRVGSSHSDGQERSRKEETVRTLPERSRPLNSPRTQGSSFPMEVPSQSSGSQARKAEPTSVGKGSIGNARSSMGWIFAQCQEEYGHDTRQVGRCVARYQGNPLAICLDEFENDPIAFYSCAGIPLKHGSTSTGAEELRYSNRRAKPETPTTDSMSVEQFIESFRPVPSVVFESGQPIETTGWRSTYEHQSFRITGRCGGFDGCCWLNLRGLGFDATKYLAEGLTDYQGHFRKDYVLVDLGLEGRAYDSVHLMNPGLGVPLGFVCQSAQTNESRRGVEVILNGCDLVR